MRFCEVIGDCVLPVEGFCLEIEELEIECTLVPFVLLVVLAGAWGKGTRKVVFESCICSKLQISALVHNPNNVKRTLKVFIHIFGGVATRTYSVRSVFLLALEPFGPCWISEVLALLGEEDEVVGGATLKFSDSYGLVVLRVVLAYAWVVLADDHVEFTSLPRFEGGLLLVWVFDDERAGMLVFAGAWNALIYCSEPFFLDVEGVLA